ncbi:MAG: hypothetical protein PX640_01045 [Microcystis sp. M49629_WE12]|nr:hypothetical protein [Microcystis sp. M49629_WE12]
MLVGLGDRRQETGDYFIYSPHTPHPTPHTLPRGKTFSVNPSSIV